MAEALRKNNMDRNDPGFMAWLEKIERGVEKAEDDLKNSRIHTPDEVRAILKERSDHAKRKL